MKRLRAVCLAWLWVLAGCRACIPRTFLVLSLPPVPPEWAAAFGEIGAEVRYAGAAGSRVEVDASPWRAGRTELTLELAPRAYTPVVVTPVPAGLGLRLRPAGAVFPLDTNADGSLLEASWEHGPAALLLARLLAGAAAGSATPEELDVERLVRDMDRTGAGDPWRVDADTLAASIAGPDGSDWLCRRLPAESVRIPASELPAWSADTFVRDDPLAPAVAIAEGEDGSAALWLPDVPVGFHRLFPLSADPDAGWLDMDVTEQETTWIARSPERPATPAVRPP